MNKSIITSALIVCFSTNLITLQANLPGKLKGKITRPTDSGINISLNGNAGTSSSSGVSDAYSIHPNLGLEVFWGGVGVGLDAGTFNTLPNFDFEKYAVPLSTLNFITTTNTRNHWTSRYVLVGPTFTLGRKHIGNVKYEEFSRHTPFHNKLEVTLSVKGGLTFNDAPTLNIIDNTNGTQKNIAAYALPAGYQTTALSVKPNFTLTYFMGTNFAVNASVQYLVQNGMAEFSTGYRDLSKVNYNLSSREVEAQLAAAPKIVTNTKGPDKYLSVGIGLTYSFRKGWDGTVKGGSKGKNNNFEKSSINNINNGMPNRISMNVTVPKQTQGATFGEKVNAGIINVSLVEGGCIVLFPDKKGYRVNTSKKTIKELSKREYAGFGEKVNQGLHAAGGALAQGASLLGGALPGGAVISAAVSSVSSLAGGAGGGAAAASYAATGMIVNPDTGKPTWQVKDDETDAIMDLPDGEYELVFVVVEKATSGLKDTLKTQVRIGFSKTNNVLKTKHDTAKNSVGNIR